MELDLIAAMGRLLPALGLACVAVTSHAAGSLRASALAGAWYPADAAALKAQVDGFLSAARGSASAGAIRALIVPHAGYVFSGPTAAEGYSLVKGRSYRRVLVLAPSHYSGFRGLSVDAVDAYRTPLGDVPLDLEAIKRLRASPLVRADADAQAQEHSIEIQLPLLQRALAPGWRLVPVLVGQLIGDDDRAAAELLRPLADDDTLVVVSSDFTHYGPRFDYRPFLLDGRTPARLKELDEGAIARIMDKDAAGFLAYQGQTGTTICGYRPIDILLRLLGPRARVERVAYTTSGALNGDYENSVSYAALSVTDPAPLSAATTRPDAVPAAAPPAGAPPAGALSESDLKALHRLAILSLDSAVLGPSAEREAATREAVAALPGHLKAPAGAFVTLKSHAELRGCIGTIEPIEPLYRAIMDNSDNAARRDPRFNPVRPSELAGLEVEVSVLTPPRPIASWEEFRVGEHGIILSKGGRRALFLPEVATEQGWTREETLSYLARKAGLAADAWREGAQFAVFTTTKYTAPYPAGH
ncbi:AmmeMemoRadiSam system protein B [uncultured Thiodictyon sp.]|uniref:AmmeMemoRadiSam system protein B n=1 Tax=uncultured Thiodictyon sp. TaxID=1846217 RepID=UPI0025D1DE07|nr:AmmeMemoRadiSam system protein B [uncultured Thiodictyon sp.]